MQLDTAPVATNFVMYRCLQGPHSQDISARPQAFPEAAEAVLV